MERPLTYRCPHGRCNASKARQREAMNELVLLLIEQTDRSLLDNATRPAALVVAVPRRPVTHGGLQGHAKGLVPPPPTLPIPARRRQHELVLGVGRQRVRMIASVVRVVAGLFHLGEQLGVLGRHGGTLTEEDGRGSKRCG